MFTREYFIKESVSFRRKMGQKSFWGDVEKASLAMKGLIYCYMHIEKETEQDWVNLNSCMLEFDRRLAYIMGSGVKYVG